MKIKNAVLCVMLTVIFLISGCSSTNNNTVQIPAVTGPFDITILKAGQADAIFMQTQNHSIILDCGEKDDGDKLVKLLQENGVTSVDYLFITHFDKDHVGGFPAVIENIDADNIIVPNYKGNNDEYKKYAETINNKTLSVTALTNDTTFTLDDVMFEVSIPKKKTYTEGDNDFSLVISSTHGENTFLFTGDAKKERLIEVISEFGKQYDFIKIPHHGKYNKNTKRFITTVKPSYSVICDSQKNPAEDKTIALLEYVGSAIYSTKEGDIRVSSNGKEIKITQ